MLKYLGRFVKAIPFWSAFCLGVPQNIFYQIGVLWAEKGWEPLLNFHMCRNFTASFRLHSFCHGHYILEKVCQTLSPLKKVSTLSVQKLAWFGTNNVGEINTRTQICCSTSNRILWPEPNQNWIHQDFKCKCGWKISHLQGWHSCSQEW